MLTYYSHVILSTVTFPLLVGLHWLPDNILFLSLRKTNTIVICVKCQCFLRLPRALITTLQLLRCRGYPQFHASEFRPTPFEECLQDVLECEAGFLLHKLFDQSCPIEVRTSAHTLVSCPGKMFTR